MTDELKPCPICGCEMSIAIKEYTYGKIRCYSIVHPDNGCILQDFESRETSARGILVDEWNRREMDKGWDDYNSHAKDYFNEEGEE